MSDRGLRSASGRGVRAAAWGGVAVLAASVMTLLPGDPGSAEDGWDDCTSKTYSYTGDYQECNVPAGVTRIGVVAVGGQGGTTTDEVTGGLGGIVRATIQVTPGEGLVLAVGGDGAEHGGFGGVRGGDHGDAPFYKADDGAGGGGSSDVRAFVGDVPLVVAGGGGGAGGGTELTFSGGVGGQGGIGGLISGPKGGFAAPGADASGYNGGGGKGGCGGCVVEAGKGEAATFGDGDGGAGGGGGGYPRSGAGGTAGQDAGGSDGGVGGVSAVGGGGGGGGGMSFAVEGSTDVSFETATTAGDGSITLVMSPPAGSAPRGPLAAPQPAGDPVTFDTPGPATWQVPASVTAVNVEVTGAGGGSDDSRPRARGDKISATVKVEPGSVVEMVVGGEGGGSGGGPGHGYTPGGDNGSTCGACDGDDGAGGGGSTSVSAAGQLLVVAGGGGGGGGDSSGAPTTPGAGGAGGLSPQPGAYSFDPQGDGDYGAGGGGGNMDRGAGGDGHDCDNLETGSGVGAGGGGGGGYFLPHMGGGGDGGETGDCSSEVGPFGAGAGGGGGRSYIEPGARDVVLGVDPGVAPPANGSVVITPVTGGTLTVYAGNGLTVYPYSQMGTVGMVATDIFGDPIPNLPVTFSAPPDTIDLNILGPDCRGKAHPECTMTTDAAGYIVFFPVGVALPWAPGPFTISVTSPGFPPAEVSGLTAALWPTTIDVTASTPTGQSAAGEPVVFSAHVASQGAVPSSSPYQLDTGRVEIAVDGRPLPGSPFPLDASGTATAPPVADLALGAHHVTARYTGDGAGQAFQPSEGSMEQNVLAVGSAVVVSSSANPVPADGEVSYEATVTTTSPDHPPTGSVQFAIDGTALGKPLPLPATAPFTVHTDTISLPADGLAPGTHQVTATYSGEAGVDSSVGTLAQTVTAVVPMTLQACFVRAGSVPDCAGAAVQGMSLLAGFVVDGAAPTGTVQFLVDGAPLGDPVPLVTGNASISTAASAPLAQRPGPVTFEARYSGDAVYAPAATTLEGPIYQDRPAVDVSSSVPIITPISDPTTFTVTVQGARGRVDSGGTVRFYNANTNRAFSGDLRLDKQEVVLADQGSCQIGSGEILVRVDYSGDPGYVLAPGSGSVTQVVLSACLDDQTPPAHDHATDPGTTPGAAGPGPGPGRPDALPDTGVETAAPAAVAAITMLAVAALLAAAAFRRPRRRRARTPGTTPRR